MKFKVTIIVESDDEFGVNAVLDAASNEAYENPDVRGIEFVSAVQVLEQDDAI